MSLELSMGFFYLLRCSIFGSCSPMQCVRVRMCVCVFSPIKYHSGIWTICADRTGARSALWSLSCCCCCCYLDWFILWHLQIRSTRFTVHSAQQESVSKRARASLCFIAATFSVIVSTLCRQSARIFRLCVCVCAWKFTCLLLRCCCRRHRRRRCSRLRFYYKNERKSNTLASERGASASVMRASRTQRKQNIKFKGKQRLWDRQGEAERKASRGRASRRRRHCCCSLLRSLASQLASFRHNSIFAAAFTCSLLCLLFSLLLLLRCSAAASELCAA